MILLRTTPQKYLSNIHLSLIVIKILQLIKDDIVHVSHQFIFRSSSRYDDREDDEDDDINKASDFVSSVKS